MEESSQDTQIRNAADVADEQGGAGMVTLGVGHVVDVDNPDAEVLEIERIVGLPPFFKNDEPDQEGVDAVGGGDLGGGSTTVDIFETSHIQTNEEYEMSEIQTSEDIEDFEQLNDRALN